MKNLKIKNVNELKKLFESYGYYPTEEILFEAYLGLKRFGTSISQGQDIYAVCLDGPAGAGKSSFIDVYKKTAKFYYDEEIEVIKYECNDTTGSSELIEEVGMVAVVTKNEEKIIIPGAIAKAIQRVNEGKKVILFIDEFDKSRKETDVFFYGFLQSGEINAVQLDDMKISPEYKSNLQVFFCKNDFRELSGPLSRRTRTLNLDYMKPDLFFEVAKNKFTGLYAQNGIMALINLITLIYTFAYQNRNKFDRLPAPSEMLIAIEDAYEISRSLKVEGKSMYGLIFRRMFKDIDSYQLFESLIYTTTEKEFETLKKYLSELKTSEEEVNTKALLENMSKSLFESIIDEKTKELEETIKEYKEKIETSKKELEKQKGLLIEERMKLRTNETTQPEINKINLNGGNLVLSENNSTIVRNFNDSTEYIKRAESVFNSINNANWTKISSMSFIKNNHQEFINSMVDFAPDLDYKIFEDGILLCNNGIGLALNATQDENGNITYNFFASTQIIPSTYIDTICNDYMNVFCSLINETPFDITINALVYNDTTLPFDSVMENVYNLNAQVTSFEELNKIISELELVCEEKNRVLESCIEMIDSHSKKLVR